MDNKTTVAFLVNVDGLDAIVFAATRAKAKWQAVKGYRDAGYGAHKSWPNVRAVRIPKYDGSFLKNGPHSCWEREYVERSIT